MPLLIGLVVVVGVVVALWRMRQVRAKRELESHSVSPETLFGLIHPERTVKVYDIRQPLDLLAHSEIIPGAVRIAPKEVLANPKLVPIDEDAVIYCTCPADETSRSVLKKLLDLEFTRVKLLRGGFEAWKAKGLPVERYDKSFRLDTAS